MKMRISHSVDDAAKIIIGWYLVVIGSIGLGIAIIVLAETALQALEYGRL